jgi:hypothetical protein
VWGSLTICSVTTLGPEGPSFRSADVVFLLL